ncbi:response regulator transcription factor [Saccharothrix sp. S26]|uniref:response regulator n=1 Tax=Saccharothrix sp. S26 TaxID=2907215 RepID=UPI001F3D6A8D|nr:response regulator transcription factor [Saccharothrix sp. S26]MCE6998207.1 response regulator transcription factor [Saccharothrix sp. S26]
MTSAHPGGITILLADDHVILREMLRESLDAEPDFTVVGDVGDGMAVVSAAARLCPDVVLLDIDMPGIPAALTVQRLREVAPRTRVVILSMYDTPAFVQDMLAQGVRGYLSKGVSRQHLVSVIRSTVRDDRSVQISVSPAAAGIDRNDDRETPLSRRERGLLELVAQALSNRQIAARLGITEATVKRHLHNIFAKIGAVSRIDAVNKAVDAGLISPPQAHRPAPLRPPLVD